MHFCFATLRLLALFLSPVLSRPPRGFLNPLYKLPTKGKKSLVRGQGPVNIRTGKPHACAAGKQAEREELLTSDLGTGRVDRIGRQY